MRSQKNKLFLIIFVATSFLVGSNASAQTMVTVQGMIAEEDGSPLPGATITTKNMETGYTYSSVSRSEGRYIISGIQPGRYEIEVTLSGFATQIREGLTFKVGATLVIDFTLTPAALREEVTVTAEAPMVEVTKSEISTVVDRQKIDDLPLLDRDFSTLVLLKAGVSPEPWYGATTNALGKGQSETLIDGVTLSWSPSQEQRATVPADAVQEFRVLTNQFEAEYGNSAGLITSAITRSGTNEFKGRMSFFYRDEAFDDVNYFVNHATYEGPELPKDQWEKSEFEHYRFGGFLGGPIKKDKAHFFIAYEGLSHTEYATVTSPLVPRETVDVTQEFNNLLLKLNYQPSEKHILSFRYGLDYRNEDNLGVGGISTKSRAYQELRRVHDLQLNWTFYPSDKSINEFRFLFATTKRPRNVEDPDAFAIVRPSGLFGSYINYPQDSRETRFHFVNNLSLFFSKHTLKFGLDYSYAGVEGFVDYLNPGQFTFLTDAPFDPNDFSTYPFLLVYNLGASTIPSSPDHSLGIFVQDSWKIHSRLTLNIGLRYNYFNPAGLRMDKWNIRNLNPRFGFSWDPMGDGKTSIRGGIGTYSSNMHASPSIYQNIMPQFDIRILIFPNYPDYTQPNPFFPSIPGTIALGEFDSIENQVAPYTLQTTLGFIREFITDFTIGADLVWAKGYRLMRQENFNPIIPGTGFIRQDPSKGDVLIMTDGGRSDYKALYFTLDKRFSRGWALTVTYTLSRSWADTEHEENTVPSYEEDGWERRYGPTTFDTSHKLVVTGIFDLPLGIQLSGLLYYRSAFPWNAVYAEDINLDGLAPDYVDYHRNSQRGFDAFSLNVRISKFFDISRFKIQLFAEGYNVTNRANFGGVFNTFGHPDFGNPTSAGSPRQIQFGARLDF